MRSVKGRVLAAVLLAAGLAPAALLLGGGAPRGVGPGSGELPAWPWCGQPPPTPTHVYPSDIIPLPPNVDGALIRAEPRADVIVLVTSNAATLGATEDEKYHPGEKTLDVDIDGVVFDGGFNDGSAPVELGSDASARLAGEVDILADILEYSKSGSVLVGLGGRTPQDSFYAYFGYDARTNEILGARSGESVVEEYIASRAGDEAMRAGSVVDWNVEYLGAPGPVMQGYQELLDQIWPPAPDIPPPGTMAYWNVAPPECRSLLDAPTKVLESLDGSPISVHIPDSMAKATDAAICVRSAYGGMGCTVMRPNPDSDVVEFEGYRDPAGGPIVVQLARLVNDEPTWSDRTTLVTLSDEELAAGTVFVELPEQIAGETYDEIVASLGAGSGG